jgi:hypothetical protein
MRYNDVIVINLHPHISFCQKFFCAKNRLCWPVSCNYFNKYLDKKSFLVLRKIHEIVGFFDELS